MGGDNIQGRADGGYALHAAQAQTTMTATTIVLLLLAVVEPLQNSEPRSASSVSRALHEPRSPGPGQAPTPDLHAPFADYPQFAAHVLGQVGAYTSISCGSLGPKRIVSHPM